MIYLEDDCLEIRFPELHENAGVSINFQRTLRLPDDGKTHHLPPGLGEFPLRHIDDFDLKNKNHLKARGGIIMPMFQADALWINFDTIQRSGDEDYPIAIKIGTGKICAVSGDNWSSTLNRDPQDYIVVPEQPWIDGYNVGKDNVRQFVAAPMGQGYTAEEQLNGHSSVGGLQIQAFPMKKEFYDMINESDSELLRYCSMDVQSMEMGLAAGGSMHQEIYEDPHDFVAWDLRKSEKCFVTIANAKQWIDITGEEPPISPYSANEYTNAGLPWFNYYGADKIAIEGAKQLRKIKAIKNIKPTDGENFWKDEPLSTKPNVVNLGKRQVNVGDW